jgi:two-component system CheB/CheR fusion protein
LSGAGSDGSLGLKDIKEAGGLIVAQDDKQAQYSGMPRSAVDTGLVDLVLKVEDIPCQLIQYVVHPLIAHKTLDIPTVRTELEKDIDKILTTVRVRLGYDFSQYKRNTIRRRVARRMAVHQIETTGEYETFLRKNPAEIDELFKDLLINVTNFFRDPHAFAALEEEVLPKLFEDRSPEDPLRIWVPACSTGEEAYSIAILFQEYMERSNQPLKMKVFATDINPAAIDRAREAVYPDNIVADVSPARLKRFFKRQDGLFYIDGSLREMVVFATHDITRESPFSRLDLVSCRNMLIYMEGELQKRIIPILHYSLKPDGFLFLGTSEGIGDLDHLFETVDKKQRIFRKKIGQGYQHLDELGLPLTRGGREKREATARPDPPSAERKKSPREMPTTKLLEELVADLGPPGVLVNKEGEICYVIGDTRPFLSPPPGEPSYKLIDMVAEPMRFRLASALDEVQRDRRRVQIADIFIQQNDHIHPVDVQVSPVRSFSRYYLVTFSKKPSAENAEMEQTGPGADRGAPARETRVRFLEEKLNRDREGPCGRPPPTPPGIRITYHGGSAD